jgi:MoaA/NifB/PqqE/SkfB family radical SAM enzyme
MTGGEPTIIPRFIDLAVAMSQWHGVSFDTNLSWEMDQLKEFCDRMPTREVSLDISFHPAAASVESILEKAAFLRDRGFQYVCRLVGFPPLLPQVEGFRRRFEDAGLKFVVNPFQGIYQGRKYPDSYSDEERRVMSGIAQPFRDGPRADPDQSFYVEHILEMHARSPEGKLCRSGQVYCRVMHDGVVYRCQPYESRGWEPLGSLLDENFALRAAPAPCRSTWCEFEYKYVIEPDPVGPRRGE